MLLTDRSFICDVSDIFFRGTRGRNVEIYTGKILSKLSMMNTFECIHADTCNKLRLEYIRYMSI